jgi:hypothetical protein
MKKLTVLVVVFSMLFFACKDVDIPKFEQPGNFWAQNLKDGKFYRVDAELVYEGSLCTVWAEKGSGISNAQARQIADEYDTKIYGKMMDAFGFTSITSNGTVSHINTMQKADSLSKNPDGKLCILLLDIKDDYKEGVNESYVAGYFWPGNFLTGSYSNYCDMIYIDTNPGLKKDTKTAYNTLAHEMQHLMNFVSSVVYRSETKNGVIYVSSMDTWIDEGLSSAAEWIYEGTHPEIRWKWYNLNGNGGQMKGLIDKGNNFFVWGNRGNESPYASLDDYATVYLFFQWLRLQSGNTGIYKDIITSNSTDYQAVTKAINTAIPSQGYSSWETLLKTWLAANRINAPTGAYGYRNDAVLKGITPPPPIRSWDKQALDFIPGKEFTAM